MSKIIAGIDPGVKTGIALWDCGKQEFIRIETMTIISAIELLSRPWSRNHIKEINFEDARLRTWFGKSGREKLQGAGSIKRDCSIWQEFCEYYKIHFEAVKPTVGQTKWSAGYFKKITGWTGRTSQHARDAAVLVFGIK